MPTVARLGADLNASDHWQYQLDDRGGVAGAVCDPFGSVLVDDHARVR